jgi:long-subunit fatty acid transport protein
MKKINLGQVATTTCALALLAGQGFAGGLDRSGQPIGLIFEEGNYVELSFGHSNPSVMGNDLAIFNPAQTPSGNVAQSFNQIAGGLKIQITDQLSAAIIYDQPWGSDVVYAAPDANPLTPGSVLLGGTQAIAETQSLTGILRYKFNDSFSLHGGLRYQQAEGNITLSGLAYGPLNGYNVSLAQDSGVGWLVGAAFERPDIALRLAVTYQSEIDHSFSTVESLAPLATTTTNTTTPQSLNIDFQTGVAQNTLLMAGIRWVDHSVVSIMPTISNTELVDIEDSTTFSLGLGRRFTENLSGSVMLSYEAASSDNLVSPLAPTNGMKALPIGLQYKKDKMKISGGVRYTKLGDAFAETGTPDVARAAFGGSDAISFGLRVGFYF